jgi:hypothetical protein
MDVWIKEEEKKEERSGRAEHGIETGRFSAAGVGVYSIGKIQMCMYQNGWLGCVCICL